MPILRISDTDAIAYDDVGQGPVIVLVHGSPGTSRAWQPVAERLGARFRVIAPNLPGYGATTRPGGEGPGDSSYAAGLLEALIAAVGRPVVLAGHSYGGVVALMTALRGRVTPGALALFEPVAVPVLAAVGEAAAFAAAQALFLERYCVAVDGGDREAVRIMVDYWFGPGTLDQMPAPMREFLVAHTEHNVRDVRATFRDPYSVEALRALSMPVLCAYGSRSPEMMVRIVQAIASHAPRGIIKKLEKANHAMTTTHAEAVASMIAELADGSA
jgi:pimeloyl-ACP methyl ester carboxylesterase